MELEIIGVPFNSAGRTDGVARAPSALHRQGLLSRARAALPAGWDVRDGGDVHFGAPSPLRDPETGLCNSDALNAMIEVVGAAVTTGRAAGRMPLVLGGDCAVLLGALLQTGDPTPLGLLFVDGHEDAWPPEASPTGEAADSELGLLLGFAPESAVPKALTGRIPLVAPDAVGLLGVRDAAEIAAAGIESLRGRVHLTSADELGDAAAADALTHIRRAADSWWFHVDLDVLSTEALPAVDYRQPGGLSWAHLTALTSTALRTPGLVGWSVTIYNPDLDLERGDAQRVVEYLAECLAELPAQESP